MEPQRRAPGGGRRLTRPPRRLSPADQAAASASAESAALAFAAQITSETSPALSAAWGAESAALAFAAQITSTSGVGAMPDRVGARASVVALA